MLRSMDEEHNDGQRRVDPEYAAVVVRQGRGGKPAPQQQDGEIQPAHAGDEILDDAPDHAEVESRFRHALGELGNHAPAQQRRLAGYVLREHLQQGPGICQAVHQAVLHAGGKQQSKAENQARDGDGNQGSCRLPQSAGAGGQQPQGHQHQEHQGFHPEQQGDEHAKVPAQGVFPGEAAEQAQIEDHGRQAEGPVTMVADDFGAIVVEIGQAEYGQGRPDQGAPRSAQFLHQAQERQYREAVQQDVHCPGCLFRRQAGEGGGPVYEAGIEQPVADLPDGAAVAFDGQQVVDGIVIDLLHAGYLPQGQQDAGNGSGQVDGSVLPRAHGSGV